MLFTKPFRIILINAPFLEQEYVKFSEKWDTIEDEYLGVGIVHQILLDQGCEVIFLNSLDREEINAVRLNFAPSAILISVMQVSAPLVKQCVIHLRKDGFTGKILLGGWFAKLSWRMIFQTGWAVDAVCFSAAETTIPQWLHGEKNIPGLATASDWKMHKDEEISTGLTSSPYTKPVRTPNRQTYAVETSRGCPHASCSFCSLTCLNRQTTRWQPIPLDVVKMQILELNNLYSTTSFAFVDDDLLGPLRLVEKRAEELAKMIFELPFKISFNCSISVKCALNRHILKLLVDCGLRQLGIGFESADESQLKRYHKAQTLEENFIAAGNIVALGIKLIPGLITFDPYSTPQSVQANLDFLFDQLHHYELGKLTKRLHLIPGTPIVKQIAQDGLLIDDPLVPEYRFQYPGMAEIYDNFVDYTRQVQLIIGCKRNQGESFRELISVHRKTIQTILTGEYDANETTSILTGWKEKNGYS